MREHHSRRTVLRTTVDLAAATTGLVAFAGPAAAHFPKDSMSTLHPATNKDPVNPRSDGVTTVAVLANDAFDPAIEVVRYRFARSRRERGQ